jgi:2-methylcitrate dehydratase PrpD
VGTGLRLPLLLATLVNGSLAHALDFDDMGAGWGHPTAVLLPPLLSLGERMGASGTDILNAYVIGYEVGSAITAGCPQYVQADRGFHGTSIFGTLVATAAAARLLRLTVTQTLMALGVAGSLAGAGLVQNFGTYAKGLHAGLASQNGVMACLMAQEGLTGTENVLESKAGFLSSHVGKDRYDLGIIRDSLGKWRLASKGMTIKKYPCCGSIHMALDSIIALLTENDIRLGDIERVDVYGMPFIHHTLMYPEPTSAFQGKFSIHYGIATAMIDRQITLESYDDEKLKRPEFREALGKLVVHVMPPWDPNYAPSAKENPVVVTLKDGRSLRRSDDRHTRHGTSANPLTDEELFGKFRMNAALSLPAASVEKALRRWWHIDQMNSVAEGLEVIAGLSAG